MSLNQIGDVGVAILAEAIRQVTSLQSLVVSANKICDVGAAILAEGIKHLSSLQSLDVSHNQVCKAGAASLGEGIKHLSSLQHLNVRNILPIGNAGAMLGRQCWLWASSKSPACSTST